MAIHFYRGNLYVMSTYTPKLAEIKQNWYVVDAKQQVLGRLASEIATYLQGKHKPCYTRFLDTGDFIVVVNCKDIIVTGKKTSDKMYHRHTGYPGGIKSANFADMMTKDPRKVLQLAVKGMLPRGPLGRKMLSKLKLFTDEQHEHAAQMPEPLQLKNTVGEVSE